MAVEFAKLGALVVLWDVNKSGNEGTARLVRETGGRAHTYICDISQKEAVYETAAKVRKYFAMLSSSGSVAHKVVGLFLQRPLSLAIYVALTSFQEFQPMIYHL